MRRLLLVISVFSLTLVSCQRPDKTRCEEACWHSRELTYWEQANAEIAAAPAAEQASLRAEKQATWEALRADTEDPKPKICAETCYKRGTKEQVSCTLAAKTVAEMRACTE